MSSFVNIPRGAALLGLSLAAFGGLCAPGVASAATSPRVAAFADQLVHEGHGGGGHGGGGHGGGGRAGGGHDGTGHADGGHDSNDHGNDTDEDERGEDEWGEDERDHHDDGPGCATESGPEEAEPTCL